MLQKLAALEPDRWSSDDTLWKGLGLEQPRRVVQRAALQRAEPGHAIALLRETYGLSADAARSFLSGLLLAMPLDDSWSLPTEQLARALVAFSHAAREAPGHLAVLASLLDNASGAPEHAERFIEALEVSPQPADTALRLVKGGQELYGWQGLLAAYAVSRQPDLLPRALDTLGLHAWGTEAALFYYAAWQRLRVQGGGGAPSRELGERVLRELLSMELPTLALDVLRQLPEAHRKQLLAGKWALRQNKEHHASDLRLDIAAAFLVSGDARGARPWFEAARKFPALVKREPWDPGCVEDVQRAILAFHLTPKPGADAFDLLRLDAACSRSMNFPMEALFLDGLKARYPQVARERLGWSLEAHAGRTRDDTVLLPERLPFLTSAREAFAAAGKVRHERLTAMLAALPEAPPAQAVTAPDPLAPRIREWLGTPATTPFTERPLGEAAKATEPPAWRALDLDRLEPPLGFGLVRAERQGERVLAVALSQRLDPVGEVSGGGYWLLDSSDGGRTWNAHVYLGLRQYRPYEVQPTSSLPMLAGDTLRLEVHVRELDEASITFPPTSLQVKREQSGLFLEAPLSALRQDTDGDGLTDLVEERLLLDAQAPDTDADGLHDGEDPLPQVPPSRGKEPMTVEARVMAAVFAWLNRDDSAPQGLEVGLPEPGQPQQPLRLPKGTTLESPLDVTFLEAERSMLRGVPVPTRTLVLSNEELTLAGKRFGQFYAMTVEVLLNTAKDQALVTWSQRWRGGRLLAKKRRNGTWVIESLGGWIS
jgi:hypothetical protein